MNILLLKPSSSHAAYGNMVPMGLAYIAAQLRKDGHEVKVHDFTLLEEEEKSSIRKFTALVEEFVTSENTLKRINDIIRKEIDQFRPDLIGISCNTAERFNMMKIARMIKEIDERIPVVVGGPHVSLTAEQALSKVNDIDIVVRGEGEKSMSELCKKMEKGEDWKKVAGLSFRKNNGIVSNPAILIQDLDSIPFPAREYFENEKYKFRIPFAALDNNVTGMVTSRGCPGRCKFCSGSVFWQGKFRFRQAKFVVDEMEEILNTYKWYDGFWIFDDNFYTVKKRAIEICEEIKKRKLDFMWGCSGRVDVMDDDIAKAMASAGCKMISFGVESGSNKILDLMNKGTNTNIIKRAIKAVRKNNIEPRGTFIFGWPGETFIDVLKTLRIMWEFESSTVNYATHVLFYPETPITNEYLPEFDWYADLPKDTPRVANIPRLVTSKNNQLRVKLLLKLIQYNFRLYTITHPSFLRKILSAKRKRRKHRDDPDMGRFIRDDPQEF